MNERTLELAKQAGLKVESWMTNPPKPFQILGSTEQFEKFAELIVRECANVCKQIGDSHISDLDGSPEFGGGAYFSAKRITQHFGVEE